MMDGTLKPFHWIALIAVVFALLWTVRPVEIDYAKLYPPRKATTTGRTIWQTGQALTADDLNREFARIDAELERLAQQRRTAK